MYDVFGVGPTLYKCYANSLCLLGYDFHPLEVVDRVKWVKIIRIYTADKVQLFQVG